MRDEMVGAPSPILTTASTGEMSARMSMRRSTTASTDSSCRAPAGLPSASHARPGRGPGSIPKHRRCTSSPARMRFMIEPMTESISSTSQPTPRPSSARPTSACEPIQQSTPRGTGWWRSIWTCSMPEQRNLSRSRYAKRKSSVRTATAGTVVQSNIMASIVALATAATAAFMQRKGSRRRGVPVESRKCGTPSL